MSTRLIAASVLTLASLAGCGSTAAVSMHKGDRIANPNRLATGAHVRILEVGDGDKQFDSTQSFKGVICSVGKSGLMNEWSDGFYEGTLEHCSNGDHSYQFKYVRIESLEKT